MTTGFDYDVFVSYSRDQFDRDVAARLQGELQRFTRPWYRPGLRTLRVFRDQTNLAASPDLWGTIEDAMSSSRWLVLVASPRAAKSPGVRRELEWWRVQRDLADICIVLIDGELRWDEAKNDFDWPTTSALPREVVAEAFVREPAWIDLRPVARADNASRYEGLRRFTRSLADPRLQDATASLIAEITNVPKDTLIGEHLRRSRQTRFAVTAVLLVLVLLLAASITAASIATSQRGRAIRQATISESGQLAALAESLTGSNLGLAELFAAEAYQLYPDTQTRAALFDAVTADPNLVRNLQAPATVTAVTGSADASTAVAGAANGNVLRWNLTDGKRTLVTRLPAAITSVAVSADATTIVAADDSATAVWKHGQGIRSLPIPVKWTVSSVAVSPSGQYVAVSVFKTVPNPDPYDGAPCRLILVDERTGRSVMAQVPSENDASNLSFSGENQLVVFDGARGSWERLSVPTLARVAASSAGFGLHDYAAAISATGRFISYTNAGPPAIWTTLSAPTPGTPPLGAQEVGAGPDALAISADGRRAAVANAGTIYVSNVTAWAKVASDSVLPLTGNDVVNPDGLAFIGSGDNSLLSASGDLVTLWNLSQYSRISTAADLAISMGCEACGGPTIDVSPKGNYAIVTANSGQSAMAARLPPSAGSAQFLPQDSASDIDYGRAVWARNGESFSIFTPSDGGGEVWSAGGHLAFVRYWRVQPPRAGAYDSDGNAPAAAMLTADGRQITEVDAAGNVVLRNPVTGAVEEDVPGPISPGSAGTNYQYLVAVDPEARYAAVIVYGQTVKVDIVDIKTRAIVSLPGGAASGVVYDGELLLVQRADGTLEVRSADGRRVIHSFAGVANPVAGPVVSKTGLLVEVDSGGTADVFDVASGQEIGSITIPAGPMIAFTGIAFSPDGNDLVTATEGDGFANDVGQIIEWSFSPGLWSQIACASAGRSLDAQEWREYVGASGPAMPSHVACES